MLAYRVHSAVSGDTFTVRMDIENFKIGVFKSSLSTFSGIAPQDQILLIGPPFKVMDALFGPDMCANGQKIFMFDKRIISDVGAVPQTVKLKPYLIPEPGVIDAPISSCLAESSSPMLRAVPDYETQFLTHIRRGESFLAAVEQAAISCKRCLEQIEVQKLSMEAAISNLNDHYTATKNSFESKQQKITVQQLAHKELLDTFDENFQQLGKIVLHPTIESLLSNYSNFSEYVGNDGEGSKPRTLTTLLDTVPVEKEFAWRDKCTQSHQKVEENMSQLKIIFDKITQSMSKLSFHEDKILSLEDLCVLSANMESSAQLQRNHMNELRESYATAVNGISKLLQSEDGRQESDVSELFALLEATRKSQEQLVIPMETCCTEVMTNKDIFAEIKTKMASRVFQTLRDIATIQTDIQYKLKKGMELMTRWRQGHNGFFQHLERIRSLPEAYATFLFEMARRRKYTEKFEAIVKDSVETISAFRSEETERREKFMEGMGRCLPPVFFEIVPSLLEKPPFFNATITERQFIPDVELEDIRDVLESFGLGMLDSSGDNMEKNVVIASKMSADNNDGSGTTLTSASSASTNVTPNSDADETEKDKKLKKCDNTTSENDAHLAALEEKILKLEEENKQLRKLASLNLRSQLSSHENNEENKDQDKQSDSALCRTETPRVEGFSGECEVGEDVMLHGLDALLATLLMDVLELRQRMCDILPSSGKLATDEG